MPPRLAPDQLLLDRVVAKTAAYTAAVGDLVEANATSAGFTVTLPSAPYTGARVTVKKTDSTGNVVTVVGQGGSTIDGDANATIVSQWAGATFVYDGTNWLVRSPTNAVSPGGINYFRRDDFTVAAPGTDSETYTLAATPIAGTVMAYIAGVLQPSSAVTVSGNTVSVNVHAATGQNVVLTYWTQTPAPGATSMTQVMSPYPTAVLTASPLAYWRLGEAAASTQDLSPMLDATANVRNGQYTGSPYAAAGLLRDGSTDTCIQFSGGFGAVASGTWMNVGSTLTLEALINLDNTGAIHPIVDRDDGSNRGFQWRVEASGKLGLVLFIGGAIPSIVGATTLVAGTTYHVAATYDGANMRVFVNGVQDGIVAQTGAINAVTCTLRVGASNAGGFAFAGRIDEVAMYGTALSAATLLDHKTKSGI